MVDQNLNFRCRSARDGRTRKNPIPLLLCISMIGLLGLRATSVVATDINFVQAAALDQPRINFALRDQNGNLLNAGPILGNAFALTAPFDTGASGVLILKDSADLIQIPIQNGVTFSDVGVAGTEQFNVSQPVFLSLQPLPGTDPQLIGSYTTTIGPIQLQLGKTSSELNFLIDGVVGMPAFKGKVVVMDPTPADSVANPTADVMRTFVYSPGTAFNPAAIVTNPGIPTVDRHVRLGYGSFDRFTSTTPAGALPPTLEQNPFIGPNPVRQIDLSLPPDDTPGIKLSFGTSSTTGSFLLDTGAAASTISVNKAAELQVRYRAGTMNTDNPLLETFDGQLVANQFTLSVSGIGGSVKRAGFYVDTLLVRTEQGNIANDNDPNHLRYGSAPLLVSDISLKDPITQQTLTLDGIFGMNMLVASANVTPGIIPSFDSLTDGQFRWIVFDEPNRKLGLSLKPERLGPAFQWARTGSGVWNSNASWDLGSVPSGSQEVVMFGPNISSNAVVNLEGNDRTVKIAKFSHDTRSYTLTSTGGRLILESQFGPAGLYLDALNTKSHVIAAPIWLKSDVDVVALANPNERLELQGGQQWNQDVQVHLLEGTLRYNLDNADAVSVGIDNSLLVDLGTKLQLAGSKSALSDGVDHVDVFNNGIVEVTGTNQSIGDLIGTGSTVLSANTSLTVDVIRQTSLTIGAGARLTIRPDGTLGTLQNLGETIAVPEPNAIVLFSLAALFVIIMVRKRRTAS